MENLPSFSGHKTTLSLTPALEYTLLACSYWRQSWTRRRAPPPKSLSTRYTSAKHIHSHAPYHGYD
jgi:hypothetical protein